MSISQSEQIGELAKTTPPIAVAGMNILGFPMSDWVLLLTAIYTLIQIAILIRRMIVSTHPENPECDNCPSSRRHR